MQCYVLPGICQRVHTIVRKQQEFWSWGKGHKVRLTQLLLLQPHLELSQGVPKPLGSHPGFSSLWSSRVRAGFAIPALSVAQPP